MENEKPTLVMIRRCEQCRGTGRVNLLGKMVECLPCLGAGKFVRPATDAEVLEFCRSRAYVTGQTR